ncbi:MAG: DUF4440 domain-containing protein [Candidatus Limnocylindria bacterium]
MVKKPREADPDRLVRERAGSYLSEDGRFRVSSDSGGAWYVTDTQRANEMGLELLIGPLPTIAAARVALATQRDKASGLAPGELPEPPPAPRPGRESKAGRAAAPEPEPPKPKPLVRRAKWRRTGDDRDDVAAALRRINDAWIEGEPERMAEDLHVLVVMVQPGFADRIEGREAAIASFREFIDGSLVHEYAESDPVIDLTGSTAVATCRWDIEWSADDRRQPERGRDVYVFAKDRGRWRAVWRVIVPEG